jgi:phosphoribosylamine--glycine ligase
VKVLIIGGGGREHALAWRLAQSPSVAALYATPGNPGIARVAQCVPSASSPQAWLRVAESVGADLTVVGPEAPLVAGVVDAFQAAGRAIVGPSARAAQLEGSKIFSKEFLVRARIPTAEFVKAETEEEALRALDRFGCPVVLKADGLAAGKGVVVAKTAGEAEEAVRAIMDERQFGDAGRRLLIEEFLRGQEVSFIVIADGAQVLPLVTTMDHKAVFDGGEGPNTGGMGTISPSPFLTKKMFAEVVSGIVLPTVTRMREEGRTYKGALYCGLMLTADGPKVLEYNCRFGDPETQPQMLRLESDLVDILMAAVQGNVLENEVLWNGKAAGCVILASGGYPGAYEKGKVIEGLEAVADMPGVAVFHAGTKFEDGVYKTGGGRVCGVCAADATLAEAMGRIYRAVSAIHFEGMHYRRDIGAARGNP